ncbi:hypothetical protein ACZ90_10175 [Streptomyces albus subsp. albus]|nr:hypothetical protein ACZ90_10175 [Streptomyces albus subsp. albus]
MLWGQEHYWFLYFDVPAFGATRDCVKITRCWHLPAPAPAEDAVRAALGELVRRYESLRTNYLVGEAGQPLQAVRPPWEPDLDISTEGEEADVPAAADRLARRPFDPARDRPIRAALLRDAQGGARVVLTAMHSAIDGQSWLVLERTFRELLAAGHRGVPAPAARQPREQALLDHSAERAAYRARTSRYWEHCFRSVPQGMFPDFRPAPVGHFSGYTPPSPYRRAVLTSRRLAVAAERVAARHRLAPGVVYLAAYGIALSALSGNERCAISMDTANRADPMLAGAVGCFFQPALVMFDVAPEETSAATLTTVFRAVVAAQRHARYSHLEMTEARARAGFERGMNLRLGVTYNYFARARPDVQTLTAALAEHTPAGQEADDFTLTAADIDWQDNSADLYLAVETAEDGVALSLHGHTSVTDAEHLARALRGIAALVCAWADGGAARTPVGELAERCGMPRRRYGPDWVYTDHSWVDTAELTKALTELPGVTAAGVFGTPSADGPLRLTAYAAGDTSPAALRTGLAALLADRPTLVLPHRFVICRAAPERSTAEAWGALADGPAEDGRSGPHRPAATPAERALAAAVTAHCPDAVPAMSDPYLTSGGRVVHAPAVVESLAGQGFSGIIPADLLGPLPLGAVAGKLRRAPAAGLPGTAAAPHPGPASATSPRKP